MTIRPTFFLLVLAVLLSACRSPTDQAAADLRENREQWEALGLHSYSFQFRRICFCGGPLQPVRVLVRADSIVSITDAVAGDSPQFLTPGWAATIDEIFDELSADAPRVASMDLSFDATFHFPSHAKVDRIKNAIDDEYELLLGDFERGDGGGS